MFGQVKEKTVSNGITFKVPFVESVKKVCNKQQQLTTGSDDSKIWGETSERTPVYFQNVTITYTISSNYSSWIYANVSNYKKSLVPDDVVASALKSAAQNLKDAEVTNRDKIERLATEKLQKSLNDKYKNEVVTINKITIGNADFEDEYNKALAEKQKAQIAYEKQAITNKQAIEKAAADAEVKLKTAQAEADAKIISAKAEKESNELLRKSITDNIIKNNAVEKWNGELPQVVGDSSVILDIVENNK